MSYYKFNDNMLEEAYAYINKYLQVEFKGSVPDDKAQAYYLGLIPEQRRDEYGYSTTIQLANILYEVLGWTRKDVLQAQSVSPTIGGTLYKVEVACNLYPVGTVFCATTVSSISVLTVAWLDEKGSCACGINVSDFLQLLESHNISPISQRELVSIPTIGFADLVNVSDLQKPEDALKKLYRVAGLSCKTEQSILLEYLRNQYAIIQPEIKSLFPQNNAGIVQAVLLHMQIYSSELNDMSALIAGDMFVCTNDFTSSSMNQAWVVIPVSIETLYLVGIPINEQCVTDWRQRRRLRTPPNYMLRLPEFQHTVTGCKQNVFNQAVQQLPYEDVEIDKHMLLNVSQLQVLSDSGILQLVDRLETKLYFMGLCRKSSWD